MFGHLNHTLLTLDDRKLRRYHIIVIWYKESKLFIGKHVPLERQNNKNFLSCNVTAQEEPMPSNIKLKSMHKVAAEGYSKCFHTENFAN